jgi:hypothetical protein
MEAGWQLQCGCGGRVGGPRPIAATPRRLRHRLVRVAAGLIGAVGIASGMTAAEPPPPAAGADRVAPAEAPPGAAEAVGGGGGTAVADSAPSPPARGTSSLGPLLLDEILRRYDLNGDGLVDDVESALGQSKLRRYRQGLRDARDVDPVTGHPRNESDPTTRSGRREGEQGVGNGNVPGLPRRDPAASDPLRGPAGSVIGLPRPGATVPDARVPGSSDARRERILSVLTAPPRGSAVPTGAGDAAGRAASPRGAAVPPGSGDGAARAATPGRDRQATGGARQPFGWVPGGNGTLFRGGSYPLPERGSGRTGSAGGHGGGALLPGAASGSGGQRGSAGSSSRATVPPSSRGTGRPGTGRPGSGGPGSGGPGAGGLGAGSSSTVPPRR